MTGYGRAVDDCVDTTAQSREWIPGKFNCLDRQHEGCYKAKDCSNEHADKYSTILTRHLGL